jgi:crossover junction endodeoxyribonuclease RuvC
LLPIYIEDELILGIDPGSRRTGFGLLRKDASTITHVSHGTIILDQRKAIADRLNELSQLIGSYRPQRAVVEDVYLSKNPRAALILGQARGAVLAVLGLHGVPVESLSPTKAKSLVSGRGKAHKFQIAQIVAIELGIYPPESPDASDALALALAYAHTLNARSYYRNDNRA